MLEIIPNWHPLVVHFTIALLLTAAVLFVLGRLAGERPLGRQATMVGRWNLALGALAALAALATGWQAYGSVAHDEPSHANMVVHLRWAAGTAVAFSAAAVVAWLDRRRVAGGSAVLLGLLVLGSGGLAVTGWLGGENVYRYGLGVMGLPKSDDHPHAEAAGGQNKSDKAIDHGAMPGMRAGSARHDAGPSPAARSARP